MPFSAINPLVILLSFWGPNHILLYNYSFSSGFYHILLCHILQNLTKGCMHGSVL